MVEPIPDEDREQTMLKLKVGFVLLVGASAGLITLHGNASPVAVLVAVTGGLVLGVLLAWYLFPDIEALSPASEKRRRFER